MKIISHNTEETERIAARFIKDIASHSERSGAVVVGLSGELGAGKTAFVKAIAKALDVPDTVTSPTFVIEKIYKLKANSYNLNHLVHIDAYRLESGDELKMLGWDGVSADPGNLIFVEWPERVQEVLPDKMIVISFKIMDEGRRNIQITNHKFQINYNAQISK